jgi:hypothetical protein
VLNQCVGEILATQVGVAGGGLDLEHYRCQATPSRTPSRAEPPVTPPMMHHAFVLRRCVCALRKGWDTVYCTACRGVRLQAW